MEVLIRPSRCRSGRAPDDMIGPKPTSQFAPDAVGYVIPLVGRYRPAPRCNTFRSRRSGRFIGGSAGRESHSALCHTSPPRPRWRSARRSAGSLRQAFPGPLPSRGVAPRHPPVLGMITIDDIVLLRGTAEVTKSTGVGCDDRQAVRHGLNDHPREAFAVTRHDEDGRVPVMMLKLAVRYGTVEADIHGSACLGGNALELRSFGPVAAYVQDHRAAGCCSRETAQGVNEGWENTGWSLGPVTNDGPLRREKFDPVPLRSCGLQQ